MGDFTEDKNEREWRRKARDSGDLEVKTSISNFVWQPQQQGILRTYSVPVNYKCAFLWHVTSSLIVKFIIYIFILHTISFLHRFKEELFFIVALFILKVTAVLTQFPPYIVLTQLTINFNKSSRWHKRACIIHLLWLFNHF